MTARALEPRSPEIVQTATEILFRRYWSGRGWTKGTITPEQFEYAKDAGVMFDPIDLDHDAVVEQAIRVRDDLNPSQVGRAFLASLSSRRLDWRSALGSLSSILHLPAHRFQRQAHSQRCAICGEYARLEEVDLSVLNFERLKWGGVRHDQPHYAAFDLEQFSILDVPQPTEGDQEIFSAVIRAFSESPATARPKLLETTLRGLVPSNGWERRTFIDILGLAGILIPRDRPTFWREYPLVADREGPRNKNDWKYPVLWWTGADGVNREALAFWFPQLT